MDTGKLLNAPSLAGQFPITFHNGFQIRTLGFWCPACNRFAPLDEVNGHISQIIENVADITAAMRCPCGEITRYQIRLRDDKTYSYLRDSIWLHGTIATRQKNKLIDRFLFKFHLCLLKWRCFKLMRSLKKLRTVLKREQNSR